MSIIKIVYKNQRNLFSQKKKRRTKNHLAPVRPLFIVDGLETNAPRHHGRLDDLCPKVTWASKIRRCEGEALNVTRLPGARREIEGGHEVRRRKSADNETGRVDGCESVGKIQKTFKQL